MKWRLNSGVSRNVIVVEAEDREIKQERAERSVNPSEECDMVVLRKSFF